MSNPSETIKYTNKCVLTVKGADNALTIYVNPDKEGTGGLSGKVYEWRSIGFASNPGGQIDLMDTLKALGGSANFAFVGANFQGPGGVDFSIQTDVGNPWTKKESLSAWTGKQWSVRVEKS